MKDPQPFFSIILPTLNRANVLSDAIQSVLSQTFEDWNLLIIDDGSADNTRNLVATFNDDRIHYVFQTNMGKSAARNRGIDLSRGEYICFLDSDDYYLQEHLEALHQEIISHNKPEALFYTGAVVKNGIEKLSIPFLKHGQSPVNYLMTHSLMINSVCLHRKILEKEKFPDVCQTWEDMHLWLRIVSRYPFIHISKHTTVVVEHADRHHHKLLNDKSLSMIHEHISCMEYLFADRKNNLSDEIISYKQVLISRELSRWIHKLLSANRFSSALKLLLKSTFTFFRYGRWFIWMKSLLKIGFYSAQYYIHVTFKTVE